MNVPHPAMTDEEYQKFAVFKKDGNRHLESGGSTDQSPWTDEFAKMIQLFRILTEDIDFSRAFRIVIDYDPEQPRTIVKHFKDFGDNYCGNCGHDLASAKKEALAEN